MYIITLAQRSGRIYVQPTLCVLRTSSLFRSIGDRSFHSCRINYKEMDEQERKERQVYSIIGEDGFDKLVSAFYRRVAMDPLLGSMYVEGLKARGEGDQILTLEPAKIRLQEYLVGRFGGPQRYIEQHGHPRLRMRHRHFAIDQHARDRWMTLMKESVEEVAFPTEASQPLMGFFEHMATHMINTD